MNTPYLLKTVLVSSGELSCDFAWQFVGILPEQFFELSTSPCPGKKEENFVFLKHNNN